MTKSILGGNNKDLTIHKIDSKSRYQKKTFYIIVIVRLNQYSLAKSKSSNIYKKMHTKMAERMHKSSHLHTELHSHKDCLLSNR